MKSKQGLTYKSTKENSATFWARVNDTIPEQMSFMPCDCALL